MYCSFPNTVQYSSTHTVSSLCMYCFFPTLYSTVQHILHYLLVCTVSSQHSTVHFNTHCIVSLYVLFISQHVQYSSTHTVSCYSTVQHKFYHLFVCTVPFPTLYNTVQHTLYHLSVFTLPFPTLYRTVQHTLYHLFLCTVLFRTLYNTVQHTMYNLFLYTVPFPIVYITRHHTQYHSTVQFNTHCIVLEYSLTQTVSCYSTVNT